MKRKRETHREEKYNEENIDEFIWEEVTAGIRIQRRTGETG